MDPIQNPLFNEPIGTMFKAKRVHMGLSQEDVSKSLRFGTHIVQAIETEQWGQLGASIYARSYIGSYCKLLGLDESIRDEIPQLQAEPSLHVVSTNFGQATTNYTKWIFILFAIVAVSALAIYVNNRKQPVESVSLSDFAPAIQTEAKPAITPVVPPTLVSETPTASATPTVLAPNVQAATMQQLIIKPNMESWIEIRDVNNAVLFSGLIKTGQQHIQSNQNLGRITVGNASQTEVSVNGVKQNTSTFTSDDVARFNINASGQLTSTNQASN